MVNFSQVSQQKQKSVNQPEHTLLYAVSSQGIVPSTVLLNDLELFLVFPVLTATNATFKTVSSSSAKWRAYPILTFIQLFLG